ncbi:MAG: TlpA family protein disulfide reductase [Bacteroidota bacterium]|nr:TlpA family protein disulfide reductase [Bacteroidota bacterium]
MKQKKLFILVITFAFCLTTKAQTYHAQYKICSESLDKLPLVDSLYFALAQKRDSCLLGVAAPNFQATTLDNKKIELSKLKGQVVVLNFWFTRCQPCIEEMPGFNKLVDFYANKKVTFISFTYDSSAMVMKFLKQHPFNFNNVAGNDEVRRNSFQLFSVWPYTIIISKEGKIMYMHFGTKGAETFNYFNKFIDKLL